jgi:titin
VFANSVQISWEAPLADGGSDITNYIVDKRETSRAEWAQVVAHIQGDVFELTTKKLIEGREYQFRVRAENRFGVGEAIVTDPVYARNPFSKISIYFFHVL